MGQPADIALPFDHALQRAFDEEIMVEHFNSFQTPTGETYFHSRLTPERDVSGNVITVLSIAREITDLKNAEVKIRLGGEFLQSVLDSSLDVIQAFKAVRDESGKIIDFVWLINNSKAVEQNGDVIGERVLAVNPGIVSAGIFERMVQVLESGISQEIEQFYSAEQFEGRWFYQSIVKLQDGIVMATRDITDQIQSEKELIALKEELAKRATELQRSNDDLRQFAHVTSHDLKEPVRKISTFYSRIIREYGSSLPEDVKNYLGRIKSATTRMTEMIEGVLHYSKLDSDVEPLQSVNLNKIIELIRTDLEVLIEHKQAEIISHNLPVINANTVLIYQLFYNLVLNSLKFAKENVPARITIASSEIVNDDAVYLRIQVSDNGIGFETEHAEMIFNTFARLNAAEAYDGSGIGLALCKKIVERHHGTISAKGIPGEGAIFTIVLPVE